MLIINGLFINVVFTFRYHINKTYLFTYDYPTVLSVSYHDIMTALHYYHMITHLIFFLLLLMLVVRDVLVLVHIDEKYINRGGCCLLTFSVAVGQSKSVREWTEPLSQ